MSPLKKQTKSGATDSKNVFFIITGPSTGRSKIYARLHGDHETQVSEGGEADLHKYNSNCLKNPGHIRFIPIDAFTINHLPEGHYDKDLYDIIKTTAELTVKISVKTTSSHRPEFWPNTKDSYPFYNLNKANLRTGSGRVSGVSKRIYDYDQYGSNNQVIRKCWCKKCQNSDLASHVWWIFYVETAAHVVFDSVEASQTTVRLFYDSEESPVVNVDQVTLDDVNVERDWCRLKCVTCDRNLGNNLIMLKDNFNKGRWKVWNKYKESRDVDKLSFTVSHPHGCSKKVSIGQWVDKFKNGKNNFTNFTYTTCTCPGSSGASVHCLGYVGGMYNHVHRGSLNCTLNFSGNGCVWNCSLKGDFGHSPGTMISTSWNEMNSTASVTNTASVTSTASVTNTPSVTNTAGTGVIKSNETQLYKL